MSARNRPLTDLCGGRFAFMPAAACEDSDLSNGAFRLYAIFCAKAKPKGTCEICLKSVAKMLGVSVRRLRPAARSLRRPYTHHVYLRGVSLSCGSIQSIT